MSYRDEDDGPHYWCYTDCNGNQFPSFEAACEYYGCDTPAQIAAEDAAFDEAWLNHCQEFDLFPDHFFLDGLASTWIHCNEECPF